MNDIRYYRQEKSYTCGPACLRMLLSSYSRLQERVSQGLTVLVEIETPDERTHQLIKELAAGGTVQRV